MARDTERFMDALRLGRHRLREVSTGMETVSVVLGCFGRALNAFSGGLVGVACVTREGHGGIEGDFLPGVPLSIVIVSHEMLTRPMPIVGGLLVAEGGFPVEVTVGARVLVAHDEGGFESALCELAASGIFSAAVEDILSSERPLHRLQS
jgi:hypothetical protein